MIEYW